MLGTLLMMLGGILLVFLALRNASPRAALDMSPDLDVIALLQKAGSDLRRPHAIDFRLRFPSEASAHAASEQLRADGDVIAVHLAADGGTAWTLQIQRTLIPAIDVLEAIRLRFEDTAKPLGGSYDGWGADVVR